MKTARLLELWREGTGLRSACDRFLADEYKQRIKEDSEQETARRFEEFEAVNQSQHFSGLIKAFRSFQPLSSDREYKRITQERIITALANKELVGIGFELPRNSSDAPKRVPSDLWYGDIDWDGSGVERSELRFAQVTIVSKNMFSSEVSGSLRISLGRPSLKPQIEKAFHELDKVGKISYQGARKRNIPIVRRFVVENFLSPDDDPNKGLEDGTISNVINPLINQGLKTKK